LIRAGLAGARQSYFSATETPYKTIHHFTNDQSLFRAGLAGARQRKLFQCYLNTLYNHSSLNQSAEQGGALPEGSYFGATYTPHRLYSV